MSTDRKLTLEDVEVCIKVVFEFYRQYRRAAKLMKAMSGGHGYALPTGRGLFDMIIQQSLSRSQGEPDEEELELSEEEVSRLEEIVAKYRESKKAESGKA